MVMQAGGNGSGDARMVRRLKGEKMLLLECVLGEGGLKWPGKGVLRGHALSVKIFFISEDMLGVDWVERD